ncbi:hypothetical protein BH10PSE7_BH10PSE7_39220 [soil metagenome]
MRIAAIDQGTTSTRLMIADTATGLASVTHTLSHVQHYPQPGFVEHDADELCANVLACVEAAGAVDAIGLDNQGCATDATTASRISLMNLETGAWDRDLCNLFNVPIEALPAIHPTVGSFGGVRGIPVTAAIVDQQAALYGQGCRDRGDIKVTFGTGAFALAVSGGEIVRSPDTGLLPTVAWQMRDSPTYAVEGGVYNAGSAVDWARRLGLFQDWSEIDQFERPPAIERGLAFVPALSGLACPYWDRTAAGLWIGLGLETDKRDMVAAVLEGVALRVSEVVNAMAQRLPLAGAISIDGGLTRSTYFCQILADATGRKLVVRESDEMTSYGTACLAAIGIGAALPPSARASEIEPQRDGSRWRVRFGDAAIRARHWRAPQ